MLCKKIWIIRSFYKLKPGERKEDRNFCTAYAVSEDVAEKLKKEILDNHQFINEVTITSDVVIEEFDKQGNARPLFECSDIPNVESNEQPKIFGQLSIFTNQ